MKPKRILAVNDIYIFPRMLDIFIREKGIPISLEKASNGHIAVEKAKAEKYDAILMNLEMPLMNGWQATKIIRTFDATTPIIAWSAHDKDRAIKGCIEVGMDDYAKIDGLDLLPNILEALNRVGVEV